jgi:Fungal specific transcription factor domain
MLDSDRARIRGLLIQMALLDDTPSSKAVLQSILALTSLYRDGQQEHAAKLKLSALHALMESPERHLSPRGGIQHIAAGILLCSFEVSIYASVHLCIALTCLLQMFRKDSSWVGHLCGAKEVITALQGQSHVPGSDFSIILGWVYYFDVLARFSLRHWRINMLQQAAVKNNWPPSACAMQFVIARTSLAREITDISSHSHQVIRLLSEVCNTILYPWGSQYYDDEYRQYLGGLESRLTKSISLTGPEIGAAPQGVIEEVSPVLELFRLATLVYLERASKNFSGQSSKLDQWTEDAFTILTQLNVCQYPFPLFIFGCEARTDSRRIGILDLISKTEEHLHLRNVQEVGELIQSVWVQEDLEVNGEVGFIRMLNLVLSSSDVVPGFV